MPTRGERHTQKILGAVRVPGGDVVWRHQTEDGNAQTSWSFVTEDVLPHFYRRRHRVSLIQDNAAYPQQPEVREFVAQPRRPIEVFPRPPDAPDLNATERRWHYTWKHRTHHRYGDRPAALCQSLFTTCIDRQQHPEKIHGLLAPFF